MVVVQEPTANGNHIRPLMSQQKIVLPKNGTKIYIVEQTHIGALPQRGVPVIVAATTFSQELHSPFMPFICLRVRVLLTPGKSLPMVEESKQNGHAAYLVQGKLATMIARANVAKPNIARILQQRSRDVSRKLDVFGKITNASIILRAFVPSFSMLALQWTIVSSHFLQ